MGGYEKDKFLEELNEINDYFKDLENSINDILNGEINKEKLFTLKKNLENFTKDISQYFKININDKFPSLNECIGNIENDYKDIYNEINSYNDSFKKDIIIHIENFLKLDANGLFRLDFKIFEFPKENEKYWIKLDKMNINSPNLFIPIINIDDNKLKCCFDTLNINLGKICPTYYNGKFKINIISFVNEDLMMKIEDYKEENIEERDINNINEEQNKKDLDELNEEQKNNKNKINQLNNIEYEEDIIENHELISVEPFSKKDEKTIQIYVEIPKYKEGTISLSCKLIINTIDKKKECTINLYIKFDLIQINLLLSCKQYKLINNYKFIKEKNDLQELYYKLDTSCIYNNEQIDFEIINVQSKEDVLFCISVKSLENNTSKKPNIIAKKKENNKIKNYFNLIIPNYGNDFPNEIPRLNCVYEIMINENFVIYIIIDAVIKCYISELYMYDFYTKNYVKDEATIHFNEKVKDTLTKKKAKLTLKFLLFSTYENKEFNIYSKDCSSIKIIPKEKRNKIEKVLCEFECFLEIRYIRNGVSQLYVDFLNNNKIEFKINFSQNPKISEDNIEFYRHFKLIAFFNNHF